MLEIRHTFCHLTPIRCETTVRESIEKMPDAFLEFFSGGNTGKMIVKL